MIKQKSDCRLPKVLVQKVGDVAYIFINLNEEECSEADDEGNVHDYFIYDFNEFHVPVDSFDLKAVEAEPEKYIDYQPDNRTVEQKVDDCELSISDLEQCIMDMSEVLYQ